MKIILLGMLIIFLLGMTAQLVVYTIMAYIKEDCSRKMMRTVFVKNTILRYEECTKLGIPVDNVSRSIFLVIFDVVSYNNHNCSFL